MCIGFLVLVVRHPRADLALPGQPRRLRTALRPRARGGAGGRAGRPPAVTRALADRRGHRVPRARDARAADLHRHAGLADPRVDPRVPRLAPGARPGGGDGGGGDERARTAPRQAGAALDPRGARPRRARGRRGRPPRVARGAGVALEPEEEPEPAATRPTKARTVSTASGPYQLPPLDLLRSAPPSTADGRDEQDTMAALERTLQTFGVDARVTGCSRGPTVSMYEVEIAAGTKVNKVLQLVERHRVRAGDARRAHHRADPGQVRDRRRGAEQAPRLRDARRHPALEGREGRDASAHGRARQGRPRPAAAGEPGDDAAHPDRGRDRRGQVQPDQLLHHVDPDADHARRRPLWC